VVTPPLVELAAAELVALPPPVPVVLLVVELAELLAEALAELLRRRSLSVAKREHRTAERVARAFCGGRASARVSVHPAV